MSAPRFVYAPSLFRRRVRRLSFIAASARSPQDAIEPPVGRAQPRRRDASEPGPANAYAPWSAVEEARLRLEHMRGRSLAETAAGLGRSVGAVRRRLRRLGLAPRG